MGKKMKRKAYNKELEKLQVELIKLQEWVKKEHKKIVVVFEGRDTAGKGGIIRRITHRLNPRFCKVVALGVPTEKEKTQWYFQRYAQHLPAAGEIVLFDRSWYNRAGVEKVLGYCTEEEYQEFLHSCPEFEMMLIRSGIVLIKYWLEISDETQEERFEERINNPLKRWKFSETDLKSREKRKEFVEARDTMFQHTDTSQSPWYVVNANNQKMSRLNCIAHLLDKIPYHYKLKRPIKLPKLKGKTVDEAYDRSRIELCPGNLLNNFIDCLLEGEVWFRHCYVDINYPSGWCYILNPIVNLVSLNPTTMKKYIALMLIGLPIFQAQAQNRVKAGVIYQAGDTIESPLVGLKGIIPRGWYGTLPQGEEVFLLLPASNKWGYMFIDVRQKSLDEINEYWHSPVQVAQNVTATLKGETTRQNDQLTGEFNLSGAEVPAVGYAEAIDGHHGYTFVFMLAAPAGQLDEYKKDFRALVGTMPK